jgi:hypothetical protein
MPSSKRNWQKPTIQGFGCANLFFVAVGLYFQVETLFSVGRRHRPIEGAPYDIEAFYIMTAMEFVSLVLLAVAGFYLLRLNRKGLLLCNVVFAYEIASLFVSSVLELALGMAGGKWALVGGSMAAAGGIGGMGTAPQILIGYPLIGLIVLNIARRGFNGHVKTD